MRKITIDLNSISNYAVFDNTIRQGENLATQIEFILSSEFIGYKYLMIFQLNNKTPVLTPEIIPVGDKVSYVITNAVTNEPGTLRVELHAYDDTGILIKTVYVNLRVAQSISGSTKVMPEAYAPWYVSVFNEEIAREISEGLRNNAEDIRKSNETNRGTAEGTRATNEIAREAAEIIRQSDESTREYKEAARQQAETIRETKEAVRISSETLRTNAESSRTNAENDRVKSEQQREEADILRGQTVEAIEANYAPRLTSAEAQINSLDDEVVVIKQQLEDGTAGIDDSIVSTEKVWSSSKVSSSLTDIATNVDGIINMGSTVYIGEENNPPTDPDIKLWFKIIKPILTMPVTDTFFHFDANSLSALEDGARIDLWEDLSGNGFNLIQQTNPVKRPTFKKTGLNDKPAVYFFSGSGDGTSYNWLYNESFTLDRNDGATLFMVFNRDNLTNSTIYPLMLGNKVETLQNGRFSVYYSNSKVLRTYVNNTLQGQVAISDSSPLLYTTAWDLSNTKIWKNGILSATTAYTGGVMIDPDILSVGSGQAGAGVAEGNFAEIVYFSRTLTTQETELMNAYLLEKWGFA